MDMKRTVKSAMQQLRIDQLRKLQTQPINSILAGQDTFVLAPTSSGKSAIYDIPALLCMDKPTIVLEPTLALMHDQVRHLNACNVSAAYPFQLLAVSRPVDISPLLSELSATLTSSSDVKQKELLKQEIVEMGAFALSGEVVERQFYIKIWDRVSDGVERDLLQKLKLLGGYFSDSGIQTEILQQQDIVRLCNLVNNPA